jgi:hypothetical protein
MSCGIQATSPPKRRKPTPGSLASSMDCLCANQKFAPGEMDVRAAHPGKDEERQLADFSPRAAVSITTPWLEPSTLMTPRHLSVADHLLKLRYPATCVNCVADLPAGARGWCDSETRSATCTACRPPQAPDPSTRPPLPPSLTPTRVLRRVQPAPRPNSCTNRSVDAEKLRSTLRGPVVWGSQVPLR